MKGYQIYGHDSDFHFEKLILLKNEDSSLHIVSRNFILNRHDLELAIRYENYNQNQFYSGDSMAFVNRKFIDLKTAIARNITRPNSKSDKDLLGLNTYPIIEGFIAKKGNFIGFVNSQSAAVNLLNEHDFELLIARSVMNVNQDKGLPERMYEKFMTHFNYKVFVAKDSKTILEKKNIYAGKIKNLCNFIDQMTDSILVLKNNVQKSDFPNLSFDGGENPGIDVISLRMAENSGSFTSPGMIRLRNRSYKQIRINPVLFSYDPEGSEKGHISLLSQTKYGYSDKETLKNLNYVQKVSKNYTVVDSHNVLEGYRDEFKTLEQDVIAKYGNEGIIGLAQHDIVLQANEIAHLKLYNFEYSKSNYLIKYKILLYGSIESLRYF